MLVSDSCLIHDQWLFFSNFVKLNQNGLKSTACAVIWSSLFVGTWWHLKKSICLKYILLVSESTIELDPVNACDSNLIHTWYKEFYKFCERYFALYLKTLFKRSVYNNVWNTHFVTCPNFVSVILLCIYWDPFSIVFTMSYEPFSC